MDKQIIVYEPNEQIKMEVKTDGETVWLTQQQMADLFGVKKAAISKHIKTSMLVASWRKKQLFPKWKQFNAEYEGHVPRTPAASAIGSCYDPP